MLALVNAGWVLMHELRGADESPLDCLLDRMQHCDLVLIEGFKNGGFPKLEVWRSAVGKPTLAPDWPGTVAVAIDGPVPLAGSTARTLDLADWNLDRPGMSVVFQVMDKAHARQAELW